MLIKTHKRMNYNKIVKHNVEMRKKYPNYPRLPKIVKLNEQQNLKLVEINPGHTESVFRGYLKRLNNFQRTYL